MSNPYQPGPYGGHAQPHPSGTTVLVLGIIGIVVCPVVSIFGLTQGNRALQEIDANPSVYDNRQTVVIGRVLSIVGLILWGLTLVLILALVALGVIGAAASR